MREENAPEEEYDYRKDKDIFLYLLIACGIIFCASMFVQSFVPGMTEDKSLSQQEELLIKSNAKNIMKANILEEAHNPRSTRDYPAMRTHIGK